MQATVEAKDCRAFGEALSELSASYFSCFSSNVTLNKTTWYTAKKHSYSYSPLKE